MKSHPEELRRRANLSNTIYGVTLILMFAYLGMQFLIDINEIKLFERIDDWVPVLLIGVVLLSFALNRRGHQKTSRSLFLLSWILLVNVIPVFFSPISVSSYFLHPIMCMLSSLMIQLFFSRHEDRWIYISFLVTSFLLTASSYYFLRQFDYMVNYLKLPVNHVQLTTIHVMAWVFINLTLMYVYRINWKAYLELGNKNETIEKLNHELESKVEMRTRLLKEQNAKLMEYAFVNAHVLRAPVSRILGLVNLLVKSKTGNSDTEIIGHLEESSKELDEVVRKLSVTLREAREDDKR